MEQEEAGSSSSSSSSSTAWSGVPPGKPEPADPITYIQVLRFKGRLKIEDIPFDDNLRAIQGRAARHNDLRTLFTRSCERLRQDLDMMCNDMEAEFTFGEVLLRQDFAVNKVRWYGSWPKDLWCFLCNNNPFLAMCFSHKLHPISRCSRWLVSALQFLFVLFLACAAAESSSCAACGIMRCGETPVCGSEETDLTASMRRNPHHNFCCACHTVWILWFIDKFGMVGSSIYIVAANATFTVVVFQLVMCGCVQHLGPRGREAGEMLGKVFVIGIACCMAVGTPALVRFIWVNGLGWLMLGHFLLGKISSGVFVSVLNVIVFSFLWWWQAPAGQGAQEPGAFHVTAEDYNEFCHSLGQEGSAIATQKC
mmetsp:Transcript_16357/g.38354  ORF Transcript_16357/g.38354 Transcript_16357/m.38354 type:complete len:366 (+) Transcript_16357:28-1125(+)